MNNEDFGFGLRAWYFAKYHNGRGSRELELIWLVFSPFISSSNKKRFIWCKAFKRKGIGMSSSSKA
ncbi:hypothetical protein O9929_00855 [Vibrio lentus]|nr:hypothetical protein [Vibrio lentus]